MRLALATALVLVVAASAAACGGDDDDDLTLGSDAQITYHFGDSSVPPEYHRSYTLTVGPTEVHAVIDSYGDVLEDVTAPLPEEVWDQLVAGIGTVSDLSTSGDEEGCAGGTTRDLQVSDGGESVLQLSFGVCGGENGDAATAVDTYVQPVLDAIPDWTTLVATE
jgi:hypothetical protein